MTGRMDGKVALITGAASGIGLATVELFIAEGARVVAADIQDEKGRLLEQRFAGALRYIHCDVTREADIAAAVALAQAEFGGLNILFNNAGISDLTYDITAITEEAWDRIFAILVRGPMLGIKHAAPVMIAGGGGSIINTSSIAALQAGYGPIAYSSAKAAVLHLSRVAAAQLSPQKVRVNAICPGLIATSIFGTALGLPREASDQLAAMVVESARGTQPVPEAGMPHHVAEAALYLASDASSFVTGTHLVVDGGVTVGGRHAWDPNTPAPLSDVFANLMATTG
ncbi:MAG: SDR family NAD(P)-dependent oxidoreductase [Brevundimonas sp.]